MALVVQWECLNELTMTFLSLITTPAKLEGGVKGGRLKWTVDPDRGQLINGVGDIFVEVCTWSPFCICTQIFLFALYDLELWEHMLA